MSKERKLLLIGGGGHCRVVLDCISKGEFDEIGVVEKSISDAQADVNIVGTDKDLPWLFEKGWTDAFITVGSAGDTSARRRLYQLIQESGFNMPTIIDASAVISNSAVVGPGCFIGKKAVVNAGCFIGTCAIVNTGAIIEHDCKLGDFSHISPGTILCGGVRVGDDSHVGAGSVIRQQISIGEKSLIGVGSVVVKDVPNEIMVYGNPCKVIE